MGERARRQQGRTCAMVGLVACATVLGGCSLRPDQAIPPQQMPAAYRNATVPLLPAMPPSRGVAPVAAPEDPPPSNQGKAGEAWRPGIYPGGKAATPVTPPADQPKAVAAAPALPVPPATPAVVETTPPTADDLSLPTPTSKWWRQFGSDELNGLVERALANNHDLKAAIERVAQAQAQAGVAGAPLLPNVQLTGGSQVSAPNGGIGTRVVSPDGRSTRLQQIGLAASYEFDFWGKNRDTRDSAVAAAEASAFDRETVALTLAADVVTSYLQYLEATDRQAVAVRNVENMNHVLDTVERRRQVGEGTDIEVAQQAAALAQARSTVPPLAQFREQARNQLAVLLGELPENLNLSGSSLASLTLPEVSGALPSALLARRPDIRRAEANLVSANAAIGAARAQLLPSFTLDAQRGVGSSYFSTLLSPASYFYLVAANVATTIFDNGKTLRQIDFSKAVYGERVEDYRQILLTALRDVENALAAVRLTAEQEAAQNDAWANARNAYQLSQVAFHDGNTDYLTILDTERNQYQTEDLKVQAQFDRLSAAVSLFRSLGGDTEDRK